MNESEDTLECITIDGEYSGRAFIIPKKELHQVHVFAGERDPISLSRPYYGYVWSMSADDEGRCEFTQIYVIP